jgi:hypothetical protein
MSDRSSSKQLERCSTVELTPEEYTTRIRTESEIGVREATVGFLRKAYGFSILCTYIIIFLQGFHCSGFQLETNFLQWLGAATIAQTAGLFAMIFRAK